MKKLFGIVGLVLALSSTTFAQTQIKVSQLPSSTALTGTEIIPIVQGGVNKKATAKDFGKVASKDSTILDSLGKRIAYRDSSKYATPTYVKQQISQIICDSLVGGSGSTLKVTLRKGNIGDTTLVISDSGYHDHNIIVKNPDAQIQTGFVFGQPTIQFNSSDGTHAVNLTQIGSTSMYCNNYYLMANSGLYTTQFKRQTAGGTANFILTFPNKSAVLFTTADTAGHWLYGISVSNDSLFQTTSSVSPTYVGSIGTTPTAISKSGDGSTTTFTVTHTANASTAMVVITPNSAVAAAPFYITNKTTTSFDIVFNTAPASGTNNITFSYYLKN